MIFMSHTYFLIQLTVFIGDCDPGDAVIGRKSHGPPRIISFSRLEALVGDRVSSPVHCAIRIARGGTRRVIPLGRRERRLIEGEVHVRH